MTNRRSWIAGVLGAIGLGFLVKETPALCVTKELASRKVFRRGYPPHGKVVCLNQIKVGDVFWRSDTPLEYMKATKRPKYNPLSMSWSVECEVHVGDGFALALTMPDGSFKNVNTNVGGAYEASQYAVDDFVASITRGRIA